MIISARRNRGVSRKPANKAALCGEVRAMVAWAR